MADGAVPPWTEGWVLPGTTYKVVEVLGSGNTSVAYSVTDELTGKQHVAVVPHDEDAPRDNARLRALHGISSPGLPRLLAVIPLEDRDVYITDFAGGVSATEFSLAPQALARAALALCHGVLRLHDVGLIHGDIAPQNVLLTPDGRAKLIDAIIPAKRGTPAFAAPEVLDGARRTPASDCYSLGVLLTKMAAGGGATPQAIGVREVADRLTRNHPGARASARAALSELVRVYNGKPPLGCPTPSVGRDGHEPQSRATSAPAPTVVAAVVEHDLPTVPSSAAYPEAPRHAPPPVPVEPAPAPRTRLERTAWATMLLGVGVALGVASVAVFAGGAAPEPAPPVSPPAAARSLAAPAEAVAAPVVAAPSAPVVAPTPAAEVLPVKARPAPTKTPTPRRAAPAPPAGEPVAASAPAAETEPARAQPVVTPADGRVRVDGAPTSTTRRYEDGGVEINNNYSPTINITH